MAREQAEVAGAVAEAEGAAGAAAGDAAVNYARPRMRRRPHSPRKQPRAKRKTKGLSQMGVLMVSWMGARRTFREPTKLASFSAVMTSPPVWRAIFSRSARLG